MTRLANYLGIIAGFVAAIQLKRSEERWIAGSSPTMTHKQIW
jgi:hypothetical protein